MGAWRDDILEEYWASIWYKIMNDSSQSDNEDAQTVHCVLKSRPIESGRRSAMQRRSDPYAPFADVYDLMAADDDFQAFYREWRESLLQSITDKKIKIRTIVDLACGTGNTTIPWAGRPDWIVVGVDRSPALLRQARAKSKRIRLYCQDLLDLNLKERAEAATCHFDALNHILDPKQLQRVFMRVTRILRDGGLFQFDLNTEYFFRWLHGREKIYQFGRSCMMASNEYNPASGIVSFHHLWFVPKGRLYEKRVVQVQERAYPTDEIRRMLKNAGLRLFKAKIQRRLAGKPIRIVYVAQKSSS
jgi:SAM-dependent methyltransferase